MTGHVALALASGTFVGAHFLLSHPLRAPLVRRIGEVAFRGLYSLVALGTFGWMIWAYRALGREASLWLAGDVLWALASVLMWFGSILFAGSLMGNPALPGARLEYGRSPVGVFAITRHPMMWGFAIWAVVHLAIVATPKALIMDGAILFLALAGSVGQDAKKRKLMGARFHEWAAQTSFMPFARGLRTPGAAAVLSGTLLFFVATWAHGALGSMPAGFWRWTG